MLLGGRTLRDAHAYANGPAWRLGTMPSSCQLQPLQSPCTVRQLNGIVPSHPASGVQRVLKSVAEETHWGAPTTAGPEDVRHCDTAAVIREQFCAFSWRISRKVELPVEHRETILQQGWVLSSCLQSAWQQQEWEQRTTTALQHEGLHSAHRVGACGSGVEICDNAWSVRPVIRIQFPSSAPVFCGEVQLVVEHGRPADSHLKRSGAITYSGVDVGDPREGVRVVAAPQLPARGCITSEEVELAVEDDQFKLLREPVPTAQQVNASGGCEKGGHLPDRSRTFRLPKGRSCRHTATGCQRSPRSSSRGSTSCC